MGCMVSGTNSAACLARVTNSFWATEYSIPAGTLVAGPNTITITVESGSTGEKFLSPSMVYDSIELY
jgi:hypothetical protein